MEVKNYVSNVRLIQAQPMTRLEYNQIRGWEMPKDENPDDPGYMVVNPAVTQRNVPGYEGYVSWLPEQAFNEQYRSESFLYSQALALLKAGKSLMRTGWNGKNMCIFYVSGQDIAKGTGYGYGQYEGEPDWHGFIAMKTTDNKLVPWLASQTDMLALSLIHI